MTGPYEYATYEATLLLSELDNHSLIKSVSTNGFFEALAELQVKKEGLVKEHRLVLARETEA